VPGSMPSVEKTPDGCLAACHQLKNHPTGAWQHAISGKNTRRVRGSMPSVVKTPDGCLTSGNGWKYDPTVNGGKTTEPAKKCS